jgi:hypothetical protein
MSYRKTSRSREATATSKEATTIRTPKPSALVMGDELEYRVARLLMFMGYFVRRGCPIYTIGSLDRATDLDVLAIRYTEPFRREMLIAECKGGREGPLDRVFWLSGVKTYVNATEAFLVRKGTKWNIKDFAKQAGVQIWDFPRITELEAGYKISDDEWPGPSDRKYYAAELDRWNKSLVNNQQVWELYLTLAAEIRYDEPFPGLNFLLYQLRLLTRIFAKPPEDSFVRFIIAESLAQASMFLMRLAALAFDLPATDRSGFIEKGLTYGNVDPQSAERVLASAYNLTRQTVFHITNKHVDAYFRMPVPPGTAQILAAVERILKLHPVSLSFPQVTDILLTEVFVKENRAKGWLKRIFPGSDLNARLSLTRDFLSLLIDAAACPRYVLDSLSATTVENGSKVSVKPSTS